MDLFLFVADGPERQEDTLHRPRRLAKWQPRRRFPLRTRHDYHRRPEAKLDQKSITRGVG